MGKLEEKVTLDSSLVSMDHHIHSILYNEVSNYRKTWIKLSSLNTYFRSLTKGRVFKVLLKTDSLDRIKRLKTLHLELGIFYDVNMQAEHLIPSLHLLKDSVITLLTSHIIDVTDFKILREMTIYTKRYCIKVENQHLKSLTIRGNRHTECVLLLPSLNTVNLRGCEIISIEAPLLKKMTWVDSYTQKGIDDVKCILPLLSSFSITYDKDSIQEEIDEHYIAWSQELIKREEEDARHTLQ